MIEQKNIDVLEEHLPYELDMLEEALRAWATSSKSAGESSSTWFTRMSAIEAFWVHARTLHEFFTRSANTEGRTACANDFTEKQMDFDFEELGKK
jgi:hypothetical protein